MKFSVITTLLLFFRLIEASAQSDGIDFGRVSAEGLRINTYSLDTSANAIVLHEFGEAYIDPDKNFEIIVKYHIRIKILKQAGISKADVSIPLERVDNRTEKINALEASAFNLVGDEVEETKLQSSNIFTEEVSKFRNLKKFAIPNVRVGTIIDYKYELQSPFVFNFFPWAFQSDIPKLSSEYWAKIPGNYQYNFSLRGPLKLSKNQNTLIPKCIMVGAESYGMGTGADCVQYKFAMNNIPAFVEEEHMTAKSNFISAINFELAEIRYFNGKVDKITREWRDADKELQLHKNFGLQIKKSKGVMEDNIKGVVAGEKDSLNVAKKIYDFIKFRYDWNGMYGMLTQFGIKEAFEKRVGNVADINLSLITALEYAGFAAEPVILSTRENGSPTELYPVLSNFNYVIAKLTVGGKTFLLDATDDFLPFGMVPMRAINGKGRVVGAKKSYWYEIKPSEKAKRISTYTLVLESDGLVKGTIQRSYLGYHALQKRKVIFSLTNQSEYSKELSKEFDHLVISNVELQNVGDFSKPLVEKFDFEFSGFQQSDAANFLFNPFITDKKLYNPFKSKERLYPVDFGAPIEEMSILSMEYADNFKISSLPDKVAIALPQNGGRYTCDFQSLGNRITMSHNLIIARTVYGPGEYHYLKELYNQLLQVQNTDLMFTKN